MSLATSFVQDRNFILVCYIVAFSLMIYGLMGLTGPRTAVRGNRIAAIGMGIAIVAALLTPTVGVSSAAMIAIPMPTAAIRFPRTAVRGPVRPISP